MFDVRPLGFSAVSGRRSGTEFQDVYDHAGCPFTLLGDSDRAHGHSRFYQVLAGLLARATKERQP